ncbi:hypothetical protein Moror_11621 [Moniliophthora roreri MCA 2997]|uniref:Uncharacterized protein n=1 Tax=Moniliophthora roreri (strain MCA 2997) TaxID=1381753 RepID=V2X3T3_MONRO|nr:hypothetical protein Moror_11621 [Moniliophthora roreri MCA 2997]
MFVTCQQETGKRPYSRGIQFFNSDLYILLTESRSSILFLPMNRSVGPEYRFMISYPAVSSEDRGLVPIWVSVNLPQIMNKGCRRRLNANEADFRDPLYRTGLLSQRQLHFILLFRRYARYLLALELHTKLPSSSPFDR